MPTYEYTCRHCLYHFEMFQSMMEKPIKLCPKCDKEDVERLMGAGAGFIFKGSGFYQTDYKREPKSSKPVREVETKTKPDLEKTKTKPDLEKT